MSQPTADPPDPPISLNLTKLVEFFEPRLEQKVAERLERRQTRLFQLLAAGATALIALSAGAATIYLETIIETTVSDAFKEEAGETLAAMDKELAFLRITTARTSLVDTKEEAYLNRQAESIDDLLAAVQNDDKYKWSSNDAFKEDLREILRFLTNNSLNYFVNSIHKMFKDELLNDPQINRTMIRHYAMNILSSDSTDKDYDIYREYDRTKYSKELGLMYNMLIQFSVNEKENMNGTIRRIQNLDSNQKRKIYQHLNGFSDVPANADSRLKDIQFVVSKFSEEYPDYIRYLNQTSEGKVEKLGEGKKEQSSDDESAKVDKIGKKTGTGVGRE